MKNKLTLLVVFLMIFCYTLPVGATPLFLDDWGVTANNLTPTSAPSNTVSVHEPYTGNDPLGQVSPGWGGYAFDANAAYIGFEGTKTYIAVVTGLPQTGSKDYWRYDNIHYPYYDWNQSLDKYWYMPGSLSLDIGGDGSHEFAITTRVTADGTDNDNDGINDSPTPGEGMLLSGNLQFDDPKAWDNYNQYTDWGGASDPWAAVGYDNLIDLGVDFSYSYFGDVTTSAGTFATYAIEAIIDTSVLGLGSGDILSMHWTMECGNDAIDISNELVSAPVPEPGTLILFGSGLLGLLYVRRTNVFNS